MSLPPATGPGPGSEPSPAAEPALPATADEVGMGLLAAGVPLSLICDLAVVDGPVSAQICAEEPADVTWCARPD